MPSQNLADSDSDENKPQPRTGGRAFYVLLVLLLIGVMGIVLFSICEGGSEWNCEFSIGILVAFASMAFGGLFGLLFGIPRSVSKPNNNKPDGHEPTTEPNTNLEQISDWLTKILVGAGLTQLNKIPRKLGDLSAYLAKGMHDLPSDRSFVTAIIIFFGICGFLGAFLWSRIYMAALLEPEQLAKLRKQLTSAGQLLDAKSALRSVLNSTNPPESQIFRSTAHEAMKKAFSVRKEFPTDRALAILMCRVERALNGYESAIRMLTQIITDFKRANKDSGPDFAALLYNRACYKARLGEELQNSGNANKKSELWKEAWDDLGESVKLDPANKEEAENDADLNFLPQVKNRAWNTPA